MRKSTLFKNHHKENWPFFNQLVVALQTQQFPKDLDELKNVADVLCEQLNLQVVQKMHHPFEPQGITLVYVLAQSHLAIHSWPEYQVLHIDLVSCVPIQKEILAKVLYQIFDPQVSYYEWMS